MWYEREQRQVSARARQDSWQATQTVQVQELTGELLKLGALLWEVDRHGNNQDSSQLSHVL